MTKKFSQGIEKVLILAKLDEGFRGKLFSDRATALDRSGVELTASERSILMSIPDEQLQTTIESTKVPDVARRAFLKGASVRIVLYLAIAALGTGVLLSLHTDKKISGNEAAVIASMRTLSSTQEQYRTRFGTYGTLKQLGDAQFIDPVLASGKKSGYTFTLETGVNTWSALAAPLTPNKTGVRVFFVDQSGVLRFTTDGSEPKREPIPFMSR